MTSSRRIRRAAYALLFATTCALAHTPRAATAAGATPGPVPSSNPLSGDAAAIDEGKKLYFKWCAQCHGAKADGVSTRFGKYAYDLRKFWRGYSEFIVIVALGRPQKQMPPWAGVLTDVEISSIGAYLETLALEGAKWTD